MYTTETKVISTFKCDCCGKKATYSKHEVSCDEIMFLEMKTIDPADGSDIAGDLGFYASLSFCNSCACEIRSEVIRAVTNVRLKVWEREGDPR